MTKTSNAKKKNMRLRRMLFLIAGLTLIVLLAVGVISYRNTITPDGIIIHHSGVTLTREGRPITRKVLDNAHRRRDFGVFYWGRTYHIGYHYLIYADGRVEQGRPERCIGAHAFGHNSTVGICLIGDFSTESNPDGENGLLEPTEAQMDALIRLSRDLRARYNIPVERVRRHQDVNGDTECPGDRFLFDAYLTHIQ
ncbi:MAG TPA: peptidoglycan recognition family protein [Pyrinomonadaceae bacterium]|jgi:hypothetical protein